ncbi:hypothetical protein E2C01_040282 [Portunus trituberculatus]|uniref:Uncharacterized protein n=1 Tax=Portunus trituberculatus TaxID=210409 RepID=A0A5B7FH38_PORTR|nr:hypothetical protein [Portunus trituberculatus]
MGVRGHAYSHREPESFASPLTTPSYELSRLTLSLHCILSRIFFTHLYRTSRTSEISNEKSDTVKYGGYLKVDILVLYKHKGIEKSARSSRVYTWQSLRASQLFAVGLVGHLLLASTRGAVNEKQREG